MRVVTQIASRGVLLKEQRKPCCIQIRDASARGSHERTWELLGQVVVVVLSGGIAGGQRGPYHRRWWWGNALFWAASWPLVETWMCDFCLSGLWRMKAWTCDVRWSGSVPSYLSNWRPNSQSWLHKVTILIIRDNGNSHFSQNLLLGNHA